MGLFRRTPKGKHALGAAVTSIPSGPLRVAAPLMAAMQPEPVPVVDAAPAEPTVMTSIAELIASGEAWESDLDDFHALHTPAGEPVSPAASEPPPAQLPAPPAEPAPLPPVQLAPPPLHVPPPAPVVAALPVAPAPLPPAVVHVPPAAAAEASARSSLEAALAELLPQQESAAVHMPPTAPRIQLGFRDGTSASLDPDSEQALALELLAQSLTRRD